MHLALFLAPPTLSPTPDICFMVQRFRFGYSNLFGSRCIKLIFIQVGILRRGLLIPTASGVTHRQRTDQGMLGDAIYFADDPSVAIKYTGRKSDVRKCLFLLFFDYSH